MYSTLLEPASEAGFDCLLQSRARPSREGRAFSAFGYPTSESGKDSPRLDGLRPGRYRIIAKYHLATTAEDNSPYWNRALSDKYGSPWNGEAYSNEVVIDIR
jgi:hypothetical protein